MVDLINMKAYTYKDFTDKEFTVGEVPADMLGKSQRVAASNFWKKSWKAMTR